MTPEVTGTDLCMAATLPRARRHGVWAALVWRGSPPPPA